MNIQVAFHRSASTKFFKSFLVMLTLALITNFASANKSSPAPKKTSPIQSTPKTWAVLVGVNKYLYNISSLPSPSLDVELFAKSLALPNEQILILASNQAESQQPTKQNIMNAIKMIASKAGANDTFWFYFSGHGISMKGKSYLVPKDARIHVEDSFVSVTEIRDLLDKKPPYNRAKRKVVVIDACNSGSTKSVGLKVGATSWEGVLGKTTGIMTMAACEVNELAIDTGRGSLFTLALLYSMDASAQTGKPQTIGELNKDVRALVQQTSKNKQNPVFVYNCNPDTPIASAPVVVHRDLPQIDVQIGRVREPLKPALVIIINEEAVQANGEVQRDTRTLLMMQSKFVEYGFPVVIEEAARKVRVTLFDSDIVKAGQQAEKLNARFLLRGTVKLTVMEKRFEAQKDFESVQATARLQLLDSVGGSVIATVSHVETGRGTTVEQAEERAIQRLSQIAFNKLYEPLKAAIEK